MKLACLSFSESGAKLGETLEGLTKYNIVHYRNGSIEGGIKLRMKDIWTKHKGIIFVSATGIATRFIAPYIKDKTTDPAVLVVDDRGRFVISLLSGHIGGANEIAEYISKEIGATPVITTASDSRGFESIDIFAKSNKYHMEDMKSITKLTSMMVNGKKIGIYTEEKAIINYPNIEVIKDLNRLQAIDGLIIVSSRNLKVFDPIKIPYTILRPKNINIGIGCRKGVEGKRIIKAIEEAFEKVDISTNSIKNIATVEVKKDERGIIEAAKYYNCFLNIFSIEDIEKVEDKFTKSQFVKDTIGVYSVSEPCAYLLGGDFLLKKEKYNGITISITMEV